MELARCIVKTREEEEAEKKIQSERAINQDTRQVKRHFRQFFVFMENAAIHPTQQQTQLQTQKRAMVGLDSHFGMEVWSSRWRRAH